jgi:hypothetical protein
VLTPEQIDAIERDAGAGLTVSAIASKHKIAYETAKRYAPNAPATRKGKKAAGGGGTKHVSKNGGSRFSDTIAVLREERERIDRVIAELEKM